MDFQKINLPPEIEGVLNTIEENGYEAYVVGGAVRDFLMGRKVSDYDVTTSARPEDIIKMFPKVIETGLKHGTVTVLTDNYAVEVTTYRVDGEYQNHRKPEKVEYSSNINDDLKRRDFTMNALAYNKSNIIDLLDGACDIENKIIRTVGDADERFAEDALRMLRAVRFSVMLGFDIADDVKDAIYKNAHLLSHISAERKKSELDRILMSEHLDKLLPYADFMSGLISGFDAFLKSGKIKVFPHLDLESRWAMVIYHSKCDVAEILKTYKFSNAEKRKIHAILKWYGRRIPEDKAFIKRVLGEIGEESFSCVIKMRKNLQGVGNVLNEIMQNREPYLTAHLAVDGNDISNIVDDSKRIGDILKALLDGVIKEPHLNEKETLLQMAVKFMEQKTVFARNLFKMRDYLGLSQQELADKAGITKTAISNYEISYSEPKRKYLERICEALGVSANDLYSDKFDPAMIKEGVFQSPTQQRMYIFKTNSYADIAISEPDYSNEYIDMPKSPAMRSGECIVVKCPDNSMDNAGFSKGEYVIISKRLNLKDGDIFALFAEGEFYIRRVSISGDIVTLIPDSNYNEYTPIQFNVCDENIIVVGKVIHSIKNY